jgi:hypothetical protein
MRIPTLIYAKAENIERLIRLIDDVTNHEVSVVFSTSTSENILQNVKKSAAICILYEPDVDNGMLLANWDSETTISPSIICVGFSDVTQYLQAAFNAGVAHVVSQPLLEQKLNVAFTRVASKGGYLGGNGRGREIREPDAAFSMGLVALPSSTGYDVRQSEHIVRLHGQGSYTNMVFMHGPPVMVCRSIGDCEQMFVGGSFMRVHRSSVVNLLHVQRIIRGKTPRLMMANGDNVDVSDRYRETLLIALHAMVQRKVG